LLLSEPDPALPATALTIDKAAALQAVDYPFYPGAVIEAEFLPDLFVTGCFTSLGHSLLDEPLNLRGTETKDATLSDIPPNIEHGLGRDHRHFTFPKHSRFTTSQSPRKITPAETMLIV
jgi:hypothetical protein